MKIKKVEQKINYKEKTMRTIKETHGKTKEMNPIEERKARLNEGIKRKEAIRKI